MCAKFHVTLSRSNFSAPAKNKDGQSSMLNPRKEFQGQIIVCKALSQSVSSGPLTVGLFFLLIYNKYKGGNAHII